MDIPKIVDKSQHFIRKFTRELYNYIFTPDPISYANRYGSSRYRDKMLALEPDARRVYDIIWKKGAVYSSGIGRLLQMPTDDVGRHLKTLKEEELVTSHSDGPNLLPADIYCIDLKLLFARRSSGR